MTAVRGLLQRELASALLWSCQPLAVAMAAAAVPPLLQAGIASSAALLLLWLRTRWQQLPVFAHDNAWRSGAAIGLLYSARLGLLYMAVARSAPLPAVLLAAGCLVLAQSLLRLLRGGARWRMLPALLLALLSLLGALIQLDLGSAAALALLAGLLWAIEIRLLSRRPLHRMAGETLVFYQLIGAVVILPMASALLDEPWLLKPDAAAWLGLLVQIAVGGVLLPALWLTPGPAPVRRLLPLLVLVAPPSTLLLQAWLLRPPAAVLAASCLLLMLAAWLAGAGQWGMAAVENDEGDRHRPVGA